MRGAGWWWVQGESESEGESRDVRAIRPIRRENNPVCAGWTGRVDASAREDWELLCEGVVSTSIEIDER